MSLASGLGSWKIQIKLVGCGEGGGWGGPRCAGKGGLMSAGGFHNYGGGANLESMPALSASRPGFGAWSFRSLGVQGLVFAEALGKQGDGGRGLAWAWEG